MGSITLSLPLAELRLVQLQDNLGALEALPKLTPEVMEQIAAIIGEGE